MVTIVSDARLENQLRAERKRTGADRYDEVWEGVYVMNPLPDNEHHRLEMAFGQILEPKKLGEVFPGVNLTDRNDDWTSDFRGPDVVVFLSTTQAENRRTHWWGPADFVVEITSPGDRTREKLAFYSRLGVRELLIVDRAPWSVELYRHREGELQLVGQSNVNTPGELHSEIMGIDSQLGVDGSHHCITISHPDTGHRWSVPAG